MDSTDLPPEAEGRLGRAAFSSGLSVPDFAACLHMGMQPVGLVQGYCVMRWSWYGPGSPYGRAGGPYGRSNWGTTRQSYSCPHGFGYGGTIGDHRIWGENFEQTWVTQAWTDGFNAAYQRMVEEAQEAGAQGVVGVVDRSSPLIDTGIREFHIYGTAIAIDGADHRHRIWTSYLAGQRLAKLIEAGFMPVSVAASMSSVRVWPVCTTEILMGGSYDRYGAVGAGDEIVQVADAEMLARRLARDHLKSKLGHDALHGADLQVSRHHVGEADLEINCTLRGTRVHRFKDADPLPAPIPTVRLR